MSNQLIVGIFSKQFFLWEIDHYILVNELHNSFCLSSLVSSLPFPDLSLPTKLNPVTNGGTEN